MCATSEDHILQPKSIPFVDIHLHCNSCEQIVKFSINNNFKRYLRSSNLTNRIIFFAQKSSHFDAFFPALQ